MTSLGIVAMLLLALVVKTILTECPENECGCTQACVDDTYKWCSDRNNPNCQCKHGCLVYDQLLKPGESRSVYCNRCACPKDHKSGRSRRCTRADWCLPPYFKAGVDYPKWWPTNPNCLIRWDF